MEKAGSVFAVNIDFIGVGHHSELGEVKVGIERLQRVKGPRYSIGKPIRQYPFPLGRFNLKPRLWRRYPGLTASMCEWCTMCPPRWP